MVAPDPGRHALTTAMSETLWCRRSVRSSSSSGAGSKGRSYGNLQRTTSMLPQAFLLPRGFQVPPPPPPTARARVCPVPVSSQDFDI